MEDIVESIKKVEEEIKNTKTALEEADQAGNERKVDRLDKELAALRQKEAQLRQKEAQLRQEKLLLLGGPRPTTHLLPPADLPQIRGDLLVPGKSDGIQGRRKSSWFSPRRSMCVSIYTMALVRRVISIDAPPRAGKTSLCQLLAELAQTDPQVGEVWTFNAADVSKGRPFEDAWESATGIDWFSASTTPPKGAEKKNKLKVIIIDEAQCTYDIEGTKSERLWGLIKHLQPGLQYRLDFPRSLPESPLQLGLQTPSGQVVPALHSAAHTPYTPQFGSNTVIVLAATYGSASASASGPTPVEFTTDCRLGLWPCQEHRGAVPQGPLPAVQLTAEESTEIFDSFCIRNSLQPEEWSFLKDFAMERSERLPGVFIHVLDQAAEVNPSKYKGDSGRLRNAFASKLLGSQFTASLGSIRGFIKYDKLLENPIACRVVEKVLLAGQAPIDNLYDDERKEALHLVRVGQLYFSSHTRNLQFATHLHAEYFTYMHYRQKVPMSGFEGWTIENFLTTVVGRMSASQLSRSLCSDASGHPYEYAYQNEFYRAGLTIIPRECFLSPEVGPFYGATGRVDYVLLPKCWAFELSREGSKIKEHSERFFPGEIYDPLIQSGIIKEYMIIDFRASNKRPMCQPDPHMIVVTFNSEFETATITQTCSNRLIAEVRLAE